VIYISVVTFLQLFCRLQDQVQRWIYMWKL